MLDSVIRFLQEGGWFMYPIAVVLCLGLVIASERFIYLRNARTENKKAFNAMLPLLKNRDLKGVANQAANNRSVVSELFDTSLECARKQKGRDDIESAMDERLLDEIPRLQKRTQYLAMLANIATLLGLLGTIIGLISAFAVVANADPAEKAALLSKSISLAMNTTAFGLVAAIPLLVCHSILNHRTSDLISSYQAIRVKIINLLSDLQLIPTPVLAAPRRVNYEENVNPE